MMNNNHLLNMIFGSYFDFSIFAVVKKNPVWTFFPFNKKFSFWFCFVWWWCQVFWLFLISEMIKGSDFFCQRAPPRNCVIIISRSICRRCSTTCDKTFASWDFPENNKKWESTSYEGSLSKAVAVEAKVLKEKAWWGRKDPGRKICFSIHKNCPTFV